MPNVTLSITQEGLKRFDEWRNGLRRPLPRGEAIIELLDLVASQPTMVGVTGPLIKQTDIPDGLRVNPDLKTLKLATGKAVLEASEDYVGVGHAKVEEDEVSKDPPVDPEALDRYYASKQPVRTGSVKSSKKDPFDQTPDDEGETF